MTLAQFALARYSRQLRDAGYTRNLTDEEAEFLLALERDIVRWQRIREEQHDETQQVPRATRPRD